MGNRNCSANDEVAKIQTSISDFYPNLFSAYPVAGFKSMKDGNHYTILVEGKRIEKYNYEGDAVVEVLFDLAEVAETASLKKTSKLHGYSFNSDETLILLITAKKMIHRDSYMSSNFIYNISTKKITELSNKGRQVNATFSPESKYVAFTRKNNIFVSQIIEDGENIEKQITADGKVNHIINGQTDWVYDEEFSFSKAFEWSPDGKNIAYIKFDESDVPQYTIQKFCGQCPSIQSNTMYPSNYTYKYPKAGENNSIVTVHVYNIESKQTLTLNVSSKLNEDIHYIPRIQFTADPQILAVYTFNRHQDHLVIYGANVNTGELKILFEDRNSRYIDSSKFKKFAFLDDGKSFVYESEVTGYNHIYVASIDGTSERRAITKGDFDVFKFYSYDSNHKEFYYSSFEESTLELHTYAIKENGEGKRKLTPDKGWNIVKFSHNKNYYVVENSAVDKVPVTELYSNDGRKIKVLKDNAPLIDIVSRTKLAIPEFLTVPAADGKTMLNALIMKPFDTTSNSTNSFNNSNNDLPKNNIPDNNMSNNNENNNTSSDSNERNNISNSGNVQKYPLIVYQYSGPNSHMVKNKYNIDWFQQLVSEGFVVACIDPRGTGARGEDFRKCTYLHLGRIEALDITSATRHLVSTFDFIDPARVGIWGWSYGGFMSLLCLAVGSDVFSTAVSVAPVTNWKFYDSIYTERFMRTPKENEEGYEFGAPLHLAEYIRNDANLLICHGTADDNVHIQNTYEMSERLVQNGMDFEMGIYTNRNHGIYGGKTSLQLHSRFVNFFKKHLMKH